MARYFLGIGLPPKESGLFDKLKQELHPQKRLTSPSHITLVSPFWWQNEEELINKIKKASKQMRGFKVTLKKVGSFKHKKYGTVFLAPDREEDLKKIARKLQEVILGQRQQGEYRAHLTIGQKVPHEQMEERKERVRQMRLKLDLKVKSITLYKMKEGKWEKAEEISLGDTSKL